MYYSAGQDVASLQRHVSAIAVYLRRHEWLWRAHVVDFFQVKLWEKVDERWNSALRLASVETLLLLPSGVVQDEWADSLKEFVRTAFQLSLSRGQVDGASNMFCSGVPQAPISNVLSQGMSAKKLHETGILAALIAGTAKSRGANDVIDVGAGQGYLALVLAFEYQLSVIAVDACAHHADVTNKRALRIQKYYNARTCKPQQDGLRHIHVRGPQTVTCRLGPGESPAALSSLLPAIKESKSLPILADETPGAQGKDRSVVLAGLHACGDLSAIMLRTFVESKEVAAVINVGCCYNLLSDSTSNDMNETNGFPMSAAVSSLGLQLGRSARDLACQSADRWKEHHPTRATQNFELHAFRAAFQLILERHYPETATKSPSVGRAGKSRRRRQARQSAMAPLCSASAVEAPSLASEQQSTRFETYAKAALERLNVPAAPAATLKSVWSEVAPHQDLVGPFYALRAVLAPVLESYILLDRLLYLKEQATGTAELVPIFDAAISPRNMAIIAQREGKNHT